MASEFGRRFETGARFVGLMNDFHVLRVHFHSLQRRIIYYPYEDLDDRVMGFPRHRWNAGSPRLGGTPYYAVSQ